MTTKKALAGARRPFSDHDGQDSSALLREPAPGKINLTLRILGKRADGYHELESLVAFTRFADRLTLRPGASLDLRVIGPTAGQAGEIADNLVLRAARTLSERVDGLRLGRFVLTKRLPAGAGLGGGSADAGAALRLLARANELTLDDPHLRDAARATGADVPICLDPRARLMRGIGDKLSEPLDIPQLGAVVVHPGVALATKEVFAAFRPLPDREKSDDGVTVFRSFAAGNRQRKARLFEQLAREHNDLEAAAMKLAPVIAEVLSRLRSLPGCRLARMSGSGSACFGLFESARIAATAARSLAAARPDWWIRATVLGG